MHSSQPFDTPQGGHLESSASGAPACNGRGGASGTGAGSGRSARRGSARRLALAGSYLLAAVAGYALGAGVERLYRLVFPLPLVSSFHQIERQQSIVAAILVICVVGAVGGWHVFRMLRAS